MMSPGQRRAAARSRFANAKILAAKIAEAPYRPSRRETDLRNRPSPGSMKSAPEARETTVKEIIMNQIATLRGLRPSSEAAREFRLSLVR